ncbi:MAG TPA: polysaccharide pyruvyl transferase family protein [bacterium]|nr:polysaccharide pyruvyl transferase family protein [bacterium]
MLKKIKSYIPNKIKAEILAFIQPKHLAEYGKYKDRKKFFIFLAGYYRNLGDMAITCAQKCFLQEHFPEHEIITVPSTSTYYLMRTMKHICGKQDIITILGGGNMDDKYTSLEDARQFVIRNFPSNRVVSFPQTMAFSDTPDGRKRLRKTARVYNKHRNLHIFTREKTSLAMMKKTFKKAQIGFCPDMVLYLNKFSPQFARKGILCCLRSDTEKSISNEEEKAVRNLLKQRYGEVAFTDTVNVTCEECRPENAESTLQKFLDLLKRKQVVVTDRLHCMIFCAVTKTPCVALKSSNHKIAGVYEEWLKDLPYIEMVREFDIKKIGGNIDSLMKIRLEECALKDFTDAFKPLLDACKTE